MYIHRHAETTVQQLAKMFGAVLVTGPRQVGKTTMLKTITREINYATMDDPILLANAQEATLTFLKNNPPPVFIDEIQKAPALFPQIKQILDAEGRKGQFFMCGSQQFKMMKNVSESLAGRIGLITLLGFSLRERQGIRFDTPFLPTDDYFKQREQHRIPIPYDEVWNAIHRGTMPELCENPTFDWQLFYAAYVKTYLERDVRELTEIGNTVKFTRFMTAAAASTGKLLNLASLANEVGISQPTADRWLSVLTASNLIYLLPPYFNNITKRAIKTPKLYFLDTGLAAYLTRWNTVEVLKNGAMAGAFFESFVISEIIKSYFNKGILDPPLYFYRDKERNEIDLLIESDGALFPIEIKKHADPKKSDLHAFSILDKIPGIRRGPGGVICLYEKPLLLRENDRIIPIDVL